MFVYGKYECFVTQMSVSCVHPVAGLSAVFCMTCSLWVGGLDHGLKGWVVLLCLCEL